MTQVFNKAVLYSNKAYFLQELEKRQGIERDLNELVKNLTEKNFLYRDMIKEQGKDTVDKA